ncbi:MAG: molybdate ABC transporter substrate-binding protein [Azonexus sp.]|jgi:molybdate transport system substrate-binding protein|nr:molybdate ABC transporter substrate-binding protein [Azonexus sp.]
MKHLPALLACLFAALCLTASASAGEVRVAVAANFAAPAQRIAAAFEGATGHRAALAFGATGKFYAQISHGAPFEVLLAADAATPARLAAEGLAVADSRLTYAVGRLALWSAGADVVDDQGKILGRGHFRRLAIANPKTAPYGAAAIETLSRLKLLETVRPKLTQGENIAQTWQFVSTGNAELGFVALSQITQDGKLTGGSVWIVPDDLHAPLRQDAILLAKGKNNAAAAAFMDYLKTPSARAIMGAFGYVQP